MKKRIYPYLVLIACALLIAVTFGFVNIQGLFFDSISADLGVGKGSVALYVTIVHIFGALFGPIGVKLRTKYSIRKILIVTGIFVVGAYSQIPSANTIWQLYICAFFMGVGQGIYGHTMVIELINNHFEKSGTFTGIALSFSGVFGSLFSPIIVNRIVNMGWRKAYYIFAIILTVVLLYSIIVIDNKPKQIQDLKENKNSNINTLCKETIFISVFYLVAGSISSLGNYMLGYSTDVGLTMSQGALLSSVMNVGNLILKLVFGFLCDAVGGFKTALISYACISIGCLTLSFCPTSLFPIIVFATALLGSSYAAANVVIQGLCKSLFGRENVSVYYASISTLSFISAFSSTGIGYVYDVTGSYKPSIIGLEILFTIAIILVVIAFKGKSNKN